MLSGRIVSLTLSQSSIYSNISWAYVWGPPLQAALVHSISLGLWLMFFAKWNYNRLQHRHSRILLHRLLTLIIVTKLLLVATASTAYLLWHLKGYERAPLSGGQLLTWGSLLSCFEGLQYATIFLTGFGWCILRPRLESREQRWIKMIFCLGLLSAVMALIAPRLYSLWALTVYAAIHRPVYRLIETNLRFLNSYLLWSNGPVIGQRIPRVRFPSLLSDASCPPLRGKIILFIQLKAAITWWVCLSMLMEVISLYVELFSTTIDTWVVIALYETIDFIVAYNFGQVFKLRDISSTLQTDRTQQQAMRYQDDLALQDLSPRSNLNVEPQSTTKAHPIAFYPISTFRQDSYLIVQLPGSKDVEYSNSSFISLLIAGKMTTRTQYNVLNIAALEDGCDKVHQRNFLRYHLIETNMKGST